MKFKNELYKDILRYTKDNGKYKQFTRRFKNFEEDSLLYNNIKIIDEQSITKRLNNLGFSPLELLTVMGLEFGDTYYSPYLMYHHKNNMEFNKKVFEEFLDSKNLKNTFIINIDENFILKALNCKKATPNITETMTKEEILYNNIPPTGFIMHAFRWATSKIKNGDNFWGGISKEWRIFYVNKIKEKYNV